MMYEEGFPRLLRFVYVAVALEVLYCDCVVHVWLEAEI